MSESDGKSPSSPSPQEPPDSAGRLRLGITLGEGGMAVVYEGYDTRIQRRAAVKCLHENLAEDDGARARFAEEIRVLGSLDHPGALPVFDEGLLEDGRPYYSMRKIRGETLQDLLSARTFDEVRDRSRLAHFLNLFERICETVAAAHEKGILHRDLKPENVMIDEFGSVFVVDWGLAKRLSKDEEGGPGRTQLGVVMGTPSFMAPEIAEGRAATSEAQADVFSLGAILYEILTGMRAFQGRTGEEVLTQVLHSAPEDPRKLNPRASRSIAAVCQKALSKDPYRRYASARELLADLRRHREHLPVSAIRPSMAERLYNASRRHPRLATAILTIAVVSLMTLSAVAFKASVDAHLVGEAKENIAEIQGKLDTLDREIADLSAKMQSLDGASPELPKLVERHEELQILRRIEHDMLEWTVWAILGFTHFTPDAEAEDLARRLVKDEIELAIRDGDLARAAASVEFTMNLLRENRLLAWTEEDETWLRDRLSDIEARQKEQREVRGASETDDNS